MHFIYSLLFLLAVMVLTLAYIAAAYFLVRIILQAVRQLIEKIRKKPGTAGAWKAVFIPKIPRKLLIFLGAFFLGYHGLLYTGQREKWMGPENAHLTAKEYWVAGQVLYGTRLLLSRFFYPDYPILYPLNQLQRAIYHRGIRYLPENDGEIGIWTQLWFVYPFGRQMAPTWGTEENRAPDSMRNLLEEAWFAIETVSTRPFADKRMETRHYLRGFPGMVFYYAFYEGYLTDMENPDRRYMHKSEKHIERTRKLIGWLEEIKGKWKHFDSENLFVQQNIKIEVMRQVALQMKLADAIQTEILQRNFSCTSDVVQKYVDARQQFYRDRNVKKVRDRKLARILEELTKDPYAVRFIRRVLRKYCKVELPGEELYPYAKKYKNARKMEKIELNFIFNEEIQILEEMYHGR